MQNKVIVIGATSGIGRELARIYSLHNYIVGATGRRVSLLEELQTEIGKNIHVRELDVTKEDSQSILQSLIAEMDGVDIIIISAGTGDLAFDWETEKETIETNVLGFTSMIYAAYEYFSEKGCGHIVAISSIGAVRGGYFPSYNASKAFVVNYLEGIRLRAFKERQDIQVTDIQPGFVDTEMAKGSGLFWVASVEKAGLQIYSAIKRRKKHAYITKRWRIIAYLLKFMPEWVYQRL